MERSYIWVCVTVAGRVASLGSAALRIRKEAATSFSTVSELSNGARTVHPSARVVPYGSAVLGAARNASCVFSSATPLFFLFVLYRITFQLPAAPLPWRSGPSLIRSFSYARYSPHSRDSRTGSRTRTGRLRFYQQHLLPRYTYTETPVTRFVTSGAHRCSRSR